MELADPGLKGVQLCNLCSNGVRKDHHCSSHLPTKIWWKWRKAGKEDDFKAIFIVPTRHLKKQQRDGFQDVFVPGQVTSLAEGQMFRDAFEKGNVRVLMITSQVLVNALTQNEFKLPEVSMLVFDECHHTTPEPPLQWNHETLPEGEESCSSSARNIWREVAHRTVPKEEYLRWLVS